MAGTVRNVYIIQTKSAYITMTQKHRATIDTTTQGRHNRKGEYSMEYRMKDIMKPPKTLEEQKKEAREAAMAAGAEVLGEEWKPGTLENVKRQVENAYTDLKGCGLYKEEKHFRNGMDLMYNNVIDIINSELGRK